MPNYLAQQREYTDAASGVKPFHERASLSPMADFAWNSSLIVCRDYLPRDLSGASLLIVNCGCGADTHFFQTEGAASVGITDISAVALNVTHRRCPGTRRVQAATEALPFADKSFDFVGVRCGLHHLEDPYAGMHEMARIARRGFFFIEHQMTPFVPLLIRLGFLDHIEEAGNVTYRFRREEVAGQVCRAGVTDYAIRTAWFMQLPSLMVLSRRVPGRLPAALLRGFVWAINLVLGRWGNSLIVVGRYEAWESARGGFVPPSRGAGGPKGSRP